MQPSNPETPEQKPSYDPNVALEFFKLYGKSESVKLGEIIFAQGAKANRLLLQSDKMYFLAKGRVNIQIGGEVVANIKPGEIFGELTPLILTVRSATAIAETPARMLTLDEKQLLNGLKEKPEFALMLMSMLVRLLRLSVARSKYLVPIDDGGIIKNNEKSAVFNPKMLSELTKKLGDDAVVNMFTQQTIFHEGGAGMLMYIILEGHAIASIGDKVVERTGPGGVIGEIALIDQRRRMAKVVAETTCTLLAINRHDFLTLVKTQPSFSISLLRSLALRLHQSRNGYQSLPQSTQSLFNGF